MSTSCTGTLKAISWCRSELVTARAMHGKSPNRAPLSGSSHVLWGSRLQDGGRMQSEPRRFLRTLLAGKPDELYVLIWTLPTKESHWFKDIEDAIEFAESSREQDVYIGV